MPIYIELSIIIVIALFFSFVMRLLRQPLIIGYIITGIVVGPYGLNVLVNSDILQVFAKIGITILLFIVGISLSPAVIRDLGKISLVTGLSQIAVTTIIGYFLSRLLGIDKLTALYLSIAFTFSSTIIIMKLISDKGDTHALYGKLAIGFLLVQDIVATIILLIISSSQLSMHGTVWISSALIVVRGLMLLIGIIAVSQFILPPMRVFISSSQELLFLFSLGWGLGMATIFHLLGFSLEIGALVAGVTISMTPYAYEAASRLRPLRDFFILLFFIVLGAQMSFSHVDRLFIPAVIFSVFILLGEPVIMVIIMNLVGFGRRTSFLTGMVVAQISEFSLILATLGFRLGHLTQDALSLITLVGLITIGVSSYMIIYAESIFPIVEHLLIWLEFRKNTDQHPLSLRYRAFLFGFAKSGQDFLDTFEELGLNYLVIDDDPHSIELLNKRNIPYRLGDFHDPEFIDDLELERMRYIIDTQDDFEANLHLLKKIRQVNKKAIVVMISHNNDEALVLYAEGANYVIMPHYLGAQYTKRIMMKHGMHTVGYEELKEKHLAYLEKRIV